MRKKKIKKPATSSFPQACSVVTHLSGDLMRINVSTIQLAARRHENSCLLVSRAKPS